MSNEDYDIISGTHGISAKKYDYFLQSFFSRKPDANLISNFGVVERLFFIFGETHEKFRYIYTFSSVTDSYLTYVRLKYTFPRMFLIVNSSQEVAIRNMAIALAHENQSLHTMDEEDINALSIMYIGNLNSICGLQT